MAGWKKRSDRAAWHKDCNRWQTSVVCMPLFLCNGMESGYTLLYKDGLMERKYKTLGKCSISIKMAIKIC